jgi:hypothetical protein
MVKIYQRGNQNPLIEEEQVSVLVQLTDSDYPFDILKLFFLIHDFLLVFVTRVTRRVLHMKQELVTLSEHLSAPQVFIGVPVTQSLVLYVCCADRCLSFCPFLLAIVLSVLLSFGHTSRKS